MSDLQAMADRVEIEALRRRGVIRPVPVLRSAGNRCWLGAVLSGAGPGQGLHVAPGQDQCGDDRGHDEDQ